MKTFLSGIGLAFVLFHSAAAQTVTGGVTTTGGPTTRGGAPVVPNCGSYAFCEAIIVDHTKVGSADLTNFPVLLVGTANTEGTGSGGKATNASGFDVTYFPTNGCTGTKLTWETDFYTATGTGSAWWLLAASVSHTTNTTIGYRCIGNAAVTTDQSNKTAVWQSAYASVWHTPNGSTLSANDSTSNANTGSITGATATTGQIDGAATLNAGANYIFGSNIFNNADVTVSAWVNLSSFTGANFLVGCVQGLNSSTADKDIVIDSSGHLQFYIYDGAVEVTTGTTAMPTGAWAYVVGTANHTAGTMSIYLNGSLVSTKTGVGSSFTAYGSPNMLAGGGASGAGYSGTAVGSVDEVRFSTTAYTAGQILAEYNNQSSPGTFYSLVTQ